VLFYIDKLERMVLLHGFIKKTADTRRGFESGAQKQEKA